jgi:hypothetical protein
VGEQRKVGARFGRLVGRRERGRIGSGHGDTPSKWVTVFVANRRYRLATLSRVSCAERVSSVS